MVICRSGAPTSSTLAFSVLQSLIGTTGSAQRIVLGYGRNMIWRVEERKDMLLEALLAIVQDCHCATRTFSRSSATLRFDRSSVFTAISTTGIPLFLFSTPVGGTGLIDDVRLTQADKKDFILKTQ